MEQLELFPLMEEEGQYTLFPVTAKRAPNLNDLFQLVPRRQQLLPVAFEDVCKKCEKKMESLPPSRWGNRFPFATLYCVKCKIHLHIFAAIPTPLLVWSDSYHQVANFSEYVEKEIRKREEKQALREKRYLHPPPSK